MSATKPRMGRPPIDNPKEVRSQICMTTADAAVIKPAAKAAGEPLQVYLVQAGLARAKREARVRAVLSQRRAKGRAL